MEKQPLCRHEMSTIVMLSGWSSNKFARSRNKFDHWTTHAQCGQWDASMLLCHPWIDSWQHRNQFLAFNHAAQIPCLPSTKIHQQNVLLSLGASGSIWELPDQNAMVVKSQSVQDQCIGLQVHQRAPASAGGKTGSADYKPRSAGIKPGSTLNHSTADWEKQYLVWERSWCAPGTYHTYFFSFNKF